MSMAETGNSERVTTSEDRPLPVAIFKNSLRHWQARWKAQQASDPADLGIPKQGRGRRSDRSARPAQTR